MTKINKSSLSSGRTQVYENTPTYDPSSYGYPIKNVISLSYEAKITKRDDLPLVAMKIKALLDVFDSRDNVPFEYKVSLNEEASILEEEDGESFGFIIPGNSFDLDALALEIVKSSLPIRLVRKGEANPSITGIKILSEEENAREKKENKIQIKGLED